MNDALKKLCKEISIDTQSLNRVTAKLDSQFLVDDPAD